MNFFKRFWIYLFPIILLAGEKQTICLNMIVKDEKPVIVRCLKSVKPFIDHWVIVDTGSTDGTQDVIRDFMKDVPGQLYERPWVDFSHNRNEALALAKGSADYYLLIDSDEILSPAPSFKFPILTADLYSIPIHLTKADGSVVVSPRAFLIRDQSACRWVGVLHENIAPESVKSVSKIENVVIKTDMISGHRSQDPNKYLKDALLLKKAVEADPNNFRNLFLMGATYELAGEQELALEIFEKCTRMKECPLDELYRSYFQVGVLQERLGKPADLFLASYEKAYKFCPNRAEPLFFMANYYVNKNDFQKAYDLLKKAVVIPLPSEQAYVERSIYTWASLYNLEVCAESLGKTNEAKQLLNKLLNCSELPPNYHEIVKQKISSLKN
jgi:glycosyltransferase involved in cell wall biosynthesis